ncbi:MAG: O-acetyl-ADP-ribose deacetylase, partial [Bacillota bacterium]
VNAANSSLMGGGGVDGAIHRAGGPRILEECKAIVARQGSLPTGKAVITTGGRLTARYVIHTVGPVWRGGRYGEPELLASAYRNSLALAAEKGLATVAFPSISTGAYGYPIEEAAPVAVEAVVHFIRERTIRGGLSLREVRFVLFSRPDFEVYRRLLASPVP